MVKKDSSTKDKIIDAISIMQENPYSPTLKTHRLHGKLKGLSASCVDYSLRIVFKIEEVDAESVIALIDIGTHDDVY